MIQIIQGEDVPAPFMTFEATGFPPEILQEVSALFLGCLFSHISTMASLLSLIMFIHQKFMLLAYQF